MMDIYFEKNYGKLYEKIERGTCEVFEHFSSTGKIRHMFIKREIPIRVGGVRYYDLITPYGYGGPLVLECEEGSKRQLIDEFKNAFEAFCAEHDIVSEFVRFHPVIGNALDFKSLYSVEYIRNTVGTNLKDFEDPFMNEFSKSARKSIRQTLKAGVEPRVIEQPDNLEDFKAIYYSTMDRNEADDYYYFDDDYFDTCLEAFGENIILVEAIYDGVIIAAGLYFVYGEIIHIHLSGTLSQYLGLSPAYILRYAATLWGKEKGLALIHHGGGTTNGEDDSLYQFKKRFGKNTEFQFFVGKKIWNDEVYDLLCGAFRSQDNGFFPEYRR